LRISSDNRNAEFDPLALLHSPEKFFTEVTTASTR
jgi:hypothetical protein